MSWQEQTVRHEAVTKSIHGPVYPEMIREGETVLRIKNIRVGKLELRDSVRLWTVSPLGMEFIWTSSIHPSIDKGSSIEATLGFGAETLRFSGLVVETRMKVAGKGEVFGVRWVNDSADATHERSERGHKRWLCGEEYLPTGMCPMPLRFNDFLYLQVRDLSAGGMKFRASLRNKLLVPGMTLEGTFTFPMIGDAQIRMEIAHVSVVRVGDKEVVEGGSKFVNLSANAQELIAQYLHQFGIGTNPKDLHKSGLTPKSVVAGLTFGSVRTQQELDDVLELRRRAWIGVGNVDEGFQAKDFTDIYDSRARIITVSHFGKIVASLRILFPEEERDFEHGSYVTLPTDLPPKDQVVEITRVVVDPNYRQGDLLYSLFGYSGIVILQAGKRYILGNSDKSILTLYSKLGAQILDTRFVNPKFGVDGRLFLFDLKKIVSGVGVNPITWNVVYKDASKYLDRNDLLKFGKWATLRLSVYAAFTPIATMVVKYLALKMRNKAKKSRLSASQNA